jgi:hypothetical protein
VQVSCVFVQLLKHVLPTFQAEGAKKIWTWYVSNVSTFPSTFALILFSNLHDLNGTNPGLTLFSAELPWCCFRAEIKVLGMTWNFRRNFCRINEKYWSQDPREMGPWWTNTHQAAPYPPGAARGVLPTSGPHFA